MATDLRPPQPRPAPADTTAAAAADSAAATATAQWWTPLRPSAAPAARLLVLPHSGAGPSRYRRIVGDLPAHVEILGLTLPGRERRYGEPPGATLDDVLDSLPDSPHPDLPTLVFGHSLGATVGLHVARALGDRCTGLIASGSIPGGRDGWLTEDTDDATILRLLDLGGDMPPALAGDTPWRAALLRTLRADLRLGTEASDRSPDLRIEAPITVLCGRDDRLVAPDDLTSWCAHFAAPGSLHLLPGGHFAVFDEANLAAVTRTVAAALPKAP
ncbi:thioesterase II family protein [Kitasatospora sp. NPDC059599]|uniref:thioesterase II family protein n=1 Tax=Kitasatospora sp. NPDC059599 TaxID=3346880 RepID=UPI003691C617